MGSWKQSFLKFLLCLFFWLCCADFNKSADRIQQRLTLVFSVRISIQIQCRRSKRRTKRRTRYFPSLRSRRFDVIGATKNGLRKGNARDPLFSYAHFFFFLPTYNSPFHFVFRFFSRSSRLHSSRVNCNVAFQCSPRSCLCRKLSYLHGCHSKRFLKFPEFLLTMGHFPDQVLVLFSRFLVR